MTEFINHSGLVFTDISSEERRIYHFSNGTGLEIDNPLWLHISDSGGHRLFDADRNSYYINPAGGWYIWWRAKPGQPNFVK